MKSKKVCTKCRIEKDLNDFYKQKGGYLGRRADCKLCSKNRITDWKLAHPDYDTEYRKKNRLMINQHSLKYYNNNKEKCNEYGRNYYVNNKEKCREYGRNYYHENSNDYNEYGKIWRSNNKEKCREYARNRYKKNLQLSTIKWMRNFLYRTEKLGFSKNGLNTIMEFGYTPKQLIQRIECQFKDGMSWENRNLWHIDHKKPISKFDEGTSPRIINMLSNLQPIWKHDNLSKGNKF